MSDHMERREAEAFKSLINPPLFPCVALGHLEDGEVRRVGASVAVRSGPIVRERKYSSVDDARRAERRLIAEKSARERFLRSKR